MPIVLLGHNGSVESFFSRFKNALALIIILLVQTVALAIQVHRPADATEPDGPQVRVLRLWTMAVMAPIERVSTNTGHGIRAAWTNYVDLRTVRQQNKDLQGELARLRLQRAELAEDALEAQRLRTLLDFKRHYVSSMVVAQVIGTSGSDSSRLLTLDKGYHDGLKADMAVITPDGVVGKLRDVFPNTSQLLLLNDPTSGAGVMLETTRIRAILRGDASGRIEINNLTPDDRIKAGERVLTSGGDQVFPRGLPVGVIESIAPDPEHQPYTAIVLKPAANLFRLEEVLIITGQGANLDPKAQQELAADAAMHAADMSAARLPTMRDAKPVDPAAADEDPSKPPPPDSTKLVPRPKPAMHPDRYSQGSAPKAEDLTPGAAKPKAPVYEPQSASPPAAAPAQDEPAATPKPKRPAAATPSKPRDAATDQPASGSAAPAATTGAPVVRKPRPPAVPKPPVEDPQ